MTGAAWVTTGATSLAAGAGTAAPPSPAITATTAPTLAVSPIWKLMSESVPPNVAGTSIEVLSVSISNRLSPGLMVSPAFTNHLTILPSATVSPSCGIRTSIKTRPSSSCRNAAPTSSSRRTASRGTPSCPSWPPSRPRPDCLVPPNGAAGSDTRPRFKPIMPKSSFSETRRPRDISFGVEISDQTVFGIVGALDRLHPRP